jgi:toxin ParE1/3/4
MNVVITDAAYADMEAIGDFIRPHNPQRAASFVDELFARCKELGDRPKAYPLVPRYEHLGIRRRVYEDYLIFYRVGKETVEVIHVIHGAQDYENMLFPKA